MLTYNNQIFRNFFGIIQYHLTKISDRINKCIIFEPNELSITQSTPWLYRQWYNSTCSSIGNMVIDIWLTGLYSDFSLTLPSFQFVYCYHRVKNSIIITKTENMELIHERCSQHLRMGTDRMKQETTEHGKCCYTRENME